MNRGTIAVERLINDNDDDDNHDDSTWLISRRNGRRDTREGGEITG